MAQTWVEAVNEDIRRRQAAGGIIGQPASDEVMRMPTAPLTPAQLEFIRRNYSANWGKNRRATLAKDQQTTTAPFPALTTEMGPPSDLAPPATMPSLTPTLVPGRKRYDELYPKGPGPFPLYPDPRGIYTPGGPDNPSGPIYPMGKENVPNMMKSGGDEIDVPTSSSVSTGKPYVGPLGDVSNPYTMDDWKWREKIRGGADPSVFGDGVQRFRGGQEVDSDLFIPQGAGGKPGEQVYGYYGPGHGNAMVRATADAKGNFNDFSGIGGVGGPNDTSRSPTQIAIQNAQLKLMGLQADRTSGPGSALANMIMQAQVQKQINSLRGQDVQDRQANVMEGRLALEAQNLKPDIEFKNAINRLYGEGAYDQITKLMMAKEGKFPVHDVNTGMGVATNIPTGGQPMYFPTLPGAPPMRPQPIDLSRYLPQTQPGALPGWSR